MGPSLRPWAKLAGSRKAAAEGVDRKDEREVLPPKHQLLESKLEELGLKRLTDSSMDCAEEKVQRCVNGLEHEISTQN